MEIDELPSGTQDQKPDIDMNEIVGTHDILMLCFDTLRYDVSVAEEASGGTPVLNSCGNGWEKRHAPGNFTYPSHFAIFAGFLPSPAEPHMLRNRKWLFFPFQAGTGRIPPKGSYAFKEATFVQSLAQVGYETICIGGVNFFSKRNDIGRVFPGYFNKSYWLPTFGCTDKNSAANQVDFAVDKLEKYPADRKVFMYINFSAIHYPNCHYVEGKRKMIKSRMRQPCGMSTVSCPACSRLSGGARTRWLLPCPITGPVTVKMVTSIIASLTKKYIRCLINTLFSENERTTADFTICQLYVQLSA